MALGSILDAVIADLGLKQKLVECRILLAWEEAAGPALAGQTHALRVRNGRLEVAVSSAVWRNQLIFIQRDLVARLNALVGEQVIKDLLLLNQ
jgi:hypothetical protein